MTRGCVRAGGRVERRASLAAARAVHSHVGVNRSRCVSSGSRPALTSARSQRDASDQHTAHSDSEGGDHSAAAKAASRGFLASWFAQFESVFTPPPRTN